MKKVALFSQPLLLWLALAACSTVRAPVEPTPSSSSSSPSETATKQDFEATALAVVRATDRDPADVALDAGRHPEALLAFAEVTPGKRVADLGAGGGYTTELFARAVGPTGQVYGQNSKFILEKFAQKPWTERLAKPVNANVVRADREFDDPLPPEANQLDVVVMNLFYHDTVWLEVDRPKMNAAIFAALKPGGYFIVVDSAARADSGTADVKTLHRIEESVVVKEVEAAGFKLVARSDVWRNPSDTKDWNSSPMAAGDRRGTSDRFALRFQRPR